MQISKFPLWFCALALTGGMILHAQDNPAQAAARAALEQKMKELDENPASVAPAVVAPVAPAAAVIAAPADAAPMVETPAPAATTPAAVAPEAATPVETAPVVATPAPAEVKISVAKPAPSSVPALSKDERLMLLLARYKADQITPEQYHTQRAAIIAEP